jgi:hypothetical protein
MTEVLAGSEAGAYEKLIASLRQAAEAARGGRFSDLTDNMRRGVEASAELGTYLSDGRLALVARALDAVRVAVTNMGSAMFHRGGNEVAAQLETMLDRIRNIRHGRLVS